MSFATSQPVVNKHLSLGDFATALRTHLLANTANRKIERLRVVANAVAPTLRVHPIRLARVLRRGAVVLAVLDLVN